MKALFLSLALTLAFSTSAFAVETHDTDCQAMTDDNKVLESSEVKGDTAREVETIKN